MLRSLALTSSTVQVGAALADVTEIGEDIRLIDKNTDKMAGYWPSSFTWTETKSRIQSYLARSGSQTQRRVFFILPAPGTSRIIKNVK